MSDQLLARPASMEQGLKAQVFVDLRKDGAGSVDEGKKL
jgi:hypothetical protein